MSQRWTVSLVGRYPVIVTVGIPALLAVLTIAVGARLSEKAQLVYGPDRWTLGLRLWWVVAAVALLALLARRRFPLTVLVVTVIATAIHSASSFSDFVPWYMPADLAAPVALYSVATNRSHRVSMSVLVAATAVVAIAGGSLEYGGFPVIALVAAWVAGEGVRSHRADRSRLEERAVQLKRQHEEEAAAERSRISRELHDVIAHSLGVIVIQAQGAAAALDHQPQRTREALAAIVSIGREALTDMRRLLEFVRPPAEDADLAPQPGLDRLPALVAAVRDTGTPVIVTIEGTARPLPAGIDVSAYRIIQEGLTNTLKHAGVGTAVSVRVHFDEHCLELRVDDAGSGGSTPFAVGHGLRGMRERVTLLGGDFCAGPSPEGGFQIKARLPVPSPAA
ncbi:MAG: sensor histidine kinase [Egibacteraceae bacterium]